MAVLSKIKSFLPGSSRSLHAMHKDMDYRFDELYRRLEQADNGINTNLNYKFDCRLFPEIDLLKERQQSLSEQNRLRFELLASRAYPDLSPFELRRKIIQSLPSAEGDIRLMQLTNAALMNKLDVICADNNIPYWFSYGSLDWFVKCRQVRFTSKNPLIPCFVDISIYDWSKDCSQQSNDLLRQLRIDLMDYFYSHEDEFSFWKENPWLFHPGSGFSVQCGNVDLEAQRKVVSLADFDRIDSVFTSFNSKAYDLGILTDTPGGDVAYGIDNIFNAPNRRIIWNHNRIFPITRHPFDDFSFCVPNDAAGVADDCYPGWPYMPLDICGHDHFAKDMLSSSDVRSAMMTLIDE